jgi:hypothetical protein
MNSLFARLPLTTKLLLLTLFPIALIVYLTIGIYKEKEKRVDLIRGYIERIDESIDISDLIRSLQAERRYSFAFALKKDVGSRAQMEVERSATDLAIKKLDERKDSTLKNFESYTFLKNIGGIRAAIDSGTSQDVVMQYYTTTIFRLNTLNLIVPVGNNKYLAPVFNDLIAQKILSEMATYLGIIRGNFYNVLYSKKNMVGTLYGLSGVFDIYKSYEAEFLTKASPSLLSEYKNLQSKPPLRSTMVYITKTFQKFSFDSLYDADQWWEMSGLATDELLNFQHDIKDRVQTSMNKVYHDEMFSKWFTLGLLVVILILVFFFMFYTSQIITRMLRSLNEAAQKISEGHTNVRVESVSYDVIGSLGKSIEKIDINNKQVAEAADAIGKGNFNVPFNSRSENDMLGNAILRMKDNLRRFTMEIE